LKATIDIIGNGSSNNLYRKTGFVVVACNVPQHKYDYDYLSIIDNNPIVWMKQNNYTPRKPVLCLRKNKATANAKEVKGEWRDVYPDRERWNSGLHAAEYFAPTYNEIHLWGMDSFYCDDFTSQMDDIIERKIRPNLNKWWRPAWMSIFDTHVKTQFIIHIPEGECCDFKKENVIVRQESLAMA
tara:strand:- start:4829 stop:5380 length:552 start_codon:yes stop_codon:yes gene_type:complete